MPGAFWPGERFAPDRIRELSRLSEEDQTRVLAEIATHGPERLKPIFEALGERITYEELHIMRMLALCLGPIISTARPAEL